MRLTEIAAEEFKFVWVPNDERTHNSYLGEMPEKASKKKKKKAEVCEFFDLNPYKLTSSGCMLIVTPRGRDLVQALCEAGIPAAIIGKTTKDQSRIIIREGEEGFLEPPKSDERFKILNGI